MRSSSSSPAPYRNDDGGATVTVHAQWTRQVRSIQKHEVTTKRKEIAGKRKGSRGFVRKLKERTETMINAVFGGLNVGDGERPHGDARTIEYLVLQLCSG